MAIKKSNLYYKVFLLIIIVLVAEIGSAMVIKNSVDTNELRKYLLSPDNKNNFPRITAHPYLNYICTPEYSVDGRMIHNEDGYRGERLALQKQEDVLRILFLGGSTTYSIAAGDALSPLPEQVKTILGVPGPNGKQRFLGKEIEVLNAGLPFGTTAELLIQYQLKYSYYQPDLVVIHTGGNDAFSYIMNRDRYQADYHHWRGNFEKHPDLSRSGEVLMRSKFISLVIIRTKYQRFITGRNYVNLRNPKMVEWFDDSTYLTNKSKNAFYHNMELLINSIRIAGSDIVLVPFIYNDKFTGYPNSETDYMNGIHNHNAWMAELASLYHTGFTDIDGSIITNEEYWIDDCHLLPEGITYKARAIAETIDQVLVTKLPQQQNSGE